MGALAKRRARPGGPDPVVFEAPEYARDLWARWLGSRGFTGSIAAQQRAYLDSRGYETWSAYLSSLGIEGSLEEQQQRFWRQFARAFTPPPTRFQRAVHYVCATSFGAWFVQKFLGMKGRIAA